MGMSRKSVANHSKKGVANNVLYMCLATDFVNWASSAHLTQQKLEFYPSILGKIPYFFFSLIVFCIVFFVSFYFLLQILVVVRSIEATAVKTQVYCFASATAKCIICLLPLQYSITTYICLVILFDYWLLLFACWYYRWYYDNLLAGVTTNICLLLLL